MSCEQVLQCFEINVLAIMSAMFFNPLRHNVPHLFVFTCLTPDNFTRQWGSSAAKWVNQKICLECLKLTLELQCTIDSYLSIFFCLSNVRQFYPSMGELCRLKHHCTRFTRQEKNV